MLTQTTVDSQRPQKSHSYHKVVLEASFASTHAGVFEGLMLLQLTVLTECFF